MSRKFCPFSFFSFYVNKDSAQAGGAHHCVESSCALWDTNLEQCGVKTACENFGGNSARPSRKPRAVSDILKKIRNKKSSTETPSDTTKTDEPSPSLPKPPDCPTEQPTAKNTNLTTNPAEPTASKDSIDKKEDIDKLLTPPPLAAKDLPIVTPSSEEINGQAKDTQ